MPVKVVWDNDEKTIIRQIYEGDVTLDDYYEATDRVVEMTKGITHTIHSILDRTNVDSSKGSMINVMRYANDKLPSNMGIRMIVRPSMLTRFFVDMGKRIAPKLIQNVFYADTVEQAIAVIKKETEATSQADASA